MVCRQHHFDVFHSFEIFHRINLQVLNLERDRVPNSVGAEAHVEIDFKIEFFAVFQNV